MRVKQQHFINGFWRGDYADSGFNAQNAQLVLAFGSPDQITNPSAFNYLREEYPKADIVFSSTSGEIISDAVYDDSIVVTAVEFEHTTVKIFATHIKEHSNSFATGAYLMEQAAGADLEGVFILSDGTFINGSELIAGFNSKNQTDIPVTGGLAGDADRFAATFTGVNSVPQQGNVIAVAFYGTGLKITYGSCGGWDEFGPERTITRSEHNVLYEIDGKNALDLYKQYLGDYARELPGSALLFPLSLRIDSEGKSLVRTILSVDEKESSMTFAGNLPEGSKVRLMKANFDKLIEASSQAADESVSSSPSPQLAIMVSCVGRKLVLNERTDEELVAAKEIFGDHTAMTGFYSYGELSPLADNKGCELHNQTMTITTFTEV